MVSPPKPRTCIFQRRGRRVTVSGVKIYHEKVVARGLLRHTWRKADTTGSTDQRSLSQRRRSALESPCSPQFAGHLAGTGAVWATTTTPISKKHYKKNILLTTPRSSNPPSRDKVFPKRNTEAAGILGEVRFFTGPVNEGGAESY